MNQIIGNALAVASGAKPDFGPVPAPTDPRTMTRVLRASDMRRLRACDSGLRRFRLAGGSVQRIGDAWVAAQAGRVAQATSMWAAIDHITAGDLEWGVCSLLPVGWDNIYYDVTRRVFRQHKLYTDGTYARRMHVRYAVFAALYVEAGIP